MKFSVCTLGCKVNTYESEYIINLFKKNGYIYENFSKACDVDVCIINTCTVTNISDQKSRKMIRQARKKNKNACVVVMGCFSQISNNIADIIEYADIIIGNNNKSKVYDLVIRFFKDNKKIVEIDDIDKFKFDDMNVSFFNTRTRALIKVEDGCENFCSYCIIPYTRGKVRSKDLNAVLEEANLLVSKGYKEIVLTGIHTGHYGADKTYDFSDLLIKLNAIDGLERIRISSIEITELNEKFIETLSKCNKIADHIHIPLQSGCDKILKLMNRKYDLDFFYKKICEIRKIRPNISITTDIIVGFPEESKSDFLDTISFVKKVNFSGGHVFPFSSRKGTKADLMDNKVPNEEKHIRTKQLIEVLSKLEDNYYINNLNKTFSIIPEVIDGDYLVGHTSNYLKVKFKGCENLLGKVVDVYLDKFDKKAIFGKKEN